MDGNNFAFSPDSKTILAGGKLDSDEGSVIVWDAATGKRQRTLTGLPPGLNDVFFRRDGKTVVCVSSDQTIAVVDAATGKLKSKHDEYDDAIDTVLSGPNTEDVAALLSDNGIRLWSLATGRTRATLYSFDNVGDYIRWLDGGQLYPASKYETRFHRPDLVAASLSRRP